MKTKIIFSFIVSLFLVSLFVSCKEEIKIPGQWSQFRGPFASGIMETTDLPDTWNVETGENIRWKTEIPGLGHSSPIVWDDKIFVTTAVNTTGKDSLKTGLYGDVDNFKDSVIKEFRVMCIDKNNGSILWNKTAHKAIPKTKRHTKASHADPTPATNGKYVVAFFGSNGLYCYTMDGELVWEKDFEKMNAGYFFTPTKEWNVSSSPVIYNNKVVIQCDILGDSFLMTLNIETGEEIWRVHREEVSTYSAPTIYEHKGTTQVIVNGFMHIGGYNLENGDEIWKMSGGGDIPIPTPVVGKGLIFIHSSHGRKSPIYAIKPGAKGDISLKNKELSNEYVEWSTNRGAAYIPTGLVYGDYYYNLVGWSGRLTCYKAKSGKEIYKESIPDGQGITASGIASNGKLYFVTEQGEVITVKAGKEFEVLARNPLNDVVMSTPAISDNTLFFKTQHLLIAVGK